MIGMVAGAGSRAIVEEIAVSIPGVGYAIHFDQPVGNVIDLEW
jgi:predicted enzyme related to lactoylglutathione lyase